MWRVTELTEKQEILAFLESDRLYAAYAIGDLEPHLYVQSAWYGASEGGRLRALALLFRGLALPALFLMGEPAGLGAILANGLRPRRAYLTCRPEHLPVTQERYAWDEVIPMWRMVLDRARFRPAPGVAVRLGAGHGRQLGALYAEAGAVGYSEQQVEQGVFYGVMVGGELVAAAGTHLLGPTYGVAAVGNVYTRPAYRGRGYGALTTSAVVEELLRRGIRDVVLNVRQSNAVAIRIYERLGFARYCAFLEGPATARERRGPPAGA